VLLDRKYNLSLHAPTGGTIVGASRIRKRKRAINADANGSGGEQIGELRELRTTRTDLH
jgi:hypothetical protein